jgi:alpha-L-rhamnosidase
LRADGSQSSHSSQQANGAALAYDICPPERRAVVGSYVASLNISIEPDHGHELLRGLHAAGRDDDIVRLLTDSSFPGWAAILAAGGTFTWETWTPSDAVGDSMSHGWGSSALVGIQEALLGAVPQAPGPGDPPTVVAITPPADVTRIQWATGTFPTPAGTYLVSWRRSRSGLRLNLGVPPNAGAQCALPATSPSQVTEGGGPVTHSPGVSVTSAAGSPLTLTVPAGTYDFFVPA